MRSNGQYARFKTSFASSSFHMFHKHDVWSFYKVIHYFTRLDNNNWVCWLCLCKPRFTTGYCFCPCGLRIQILIVVYGYLFYLSRVSSLLRNNCLPFVLWMPPPTALRNMFDIRFFGNFLLAFFYRHWLWLATLVQGNRNCIRGRLKYFVMKLSFGKSGYFVVCLQNSFLMRPFHNCLPQGVRAAKNGLSRN